ncbi:hypothetical protein [Sphingomonas dokdonensis]|uniref:Uncharacterized protein n=1 Tax=Sphingomonas dokdonensis TaxID=344880 RepID=A0A245ZCX8_9SPHN|nr:hypothetical protein [Sphingomonas dokdonensis]OWK27554.1 hypothetical protein SPDO_32370 [Sphingomonas dokdonensis]
MAGNELELAIAEAERWAAHVERFGYERMGVGPDASPHMLAAAAKKLAALSKGEAAHG